MQAGISAGDAILQADGNVLHDILDWHWWADGDVVTLLVRHEDCRIDEVELAREPMQSWGIEFQDPLFDGTMPCCNNCTFCFMKMLPDDARPSLKVRDDDFRLSFIQGNFVTLTNLREEHVERIIQQNISPLRFSLHASNPDVRRALIGPRADRGLSVAQQLLDSGISLHAQIVLVPGVNDGAILEETLRWAYERPGILNVGIVPVGYTRYQTTFSAGFDDPESARAVIEMLEPFRYRAWQERTTPWVYASDEFYRVAYGSKLLEHLPESCSYGDFDLYEDGIGMIRAFVDDWNGSFGMQKQLSAALSRQGKRIVFASGEATREFIDPLVQASPLAGTMDIIHVKNDYFGGNVNVTGLLCGCDIARSLADHASAHKDEAVYAMVPNSVLNAEGLLLDGMTLDEVSSRAGMQVHVVSCQPAEAFEQMASIVGQPCA